MEKSDESKIFLLFPRRGIFLGLFICEESSLMQGGIKKYGELMVRGMCLG